MDEVNEDERGGEVPTWADLFERATAYEVDEAGVSEALSRRRERADD